MSKIIYVNLTIIIFIVFLSGFFLYSSVFYPSYMSYVANCNPNWEEIYEEHGRVVVAQVVTNQTSGNYSINIVNGDYYDETTRKHEKIHVNQFLNGRFWGCSHPVFNFLNEVEAYIGQNFPDLIFDRVYP